MEKLKHNYGKVMIIIFTMIFTIFVSGGLTFRTNANSEGAIRAENTRLLNENMSLKQKFIKLEQELDSMENKVNEIYNLDNTLYAQILGVDFDTTNFHNYRNDSAISIIKLNNSIFNNVDDRMLYASEMLALRLKELKRTSKYLKENKYVINYYPDISPIKTKNFINLSSPYGWRKHPIYDKMIFHDGVDISARPGSKVYATAQGTVVKIMYSKYGYGNRVVIKHAYGFETLYAHLGLIKVKRGQWVNKNQIIGTVGNTGLSTGPHLHYEIHKNNKTRDPLGYFYTNVTEELLANK